MNSRIDFLRNAVKFFIEEMMFKPSNEVHRTNDLRLPLQEKLNEDLKFETHVIVAVVQNGEVAGEIVYVDKTGSFSKTNFVVCYDEEYANIIRNY